MFESSQTKLIRKVADDHRKIHLSSVMCWLSLKLFAQQFGLKHRKPESPALHFCKGNPPKTGGVSSQTASNGESVSRTFLFEVQMMTSLRRTFLFEVYMMLISIMYCMTISNWHECFTREKSKWLVKCMAFNINWCCLTLDSILWWLTGSVFRMCDRYIVIQLSA